MNQVRIGDRTLPWSQADTLLEALEKAAIPIAASCRAGACHSCLVKGMPDQVPAEAQIGLKPAWKAQGLFLACQSRTPRDMTIALPGHSENVSARLQSKTLLAPDVLQLRFQVDGAFSFHPGQFISLIRHDGLTRSYSIASLPEDGFLELHVRVVEQGQMSHYLQHSARVGETFQVRGPQGDCFYIEGRPEQPLILLGTGTGLAPLMGILRDAIVKQHRGPVFLYHGGRHRADLYLQDILTNLSQAQAHFEYRPVLSDDPDAPGIRKGRLGPVVLKEIPDLKGFRAFVCGSPPMVREAKVFLSKAGVAATDILSDAFIQSPLHRSQSLLLPRGGAKVDGI
jgi:CDP-4-dehydro-6-deoxyglucose reductase, E3